MEVDKMIKKIGFYIRKEKYGWLSNFERCEQTVHGIIYPTNEHYYQAQKAKGKDVAEWIAKAPKAYQAMMAGRSLRDKEIVDDWDNKKVVVMLIGLRAKFRNPELIKKLLDTGDAELYEDSPTDMFWGVKGENMLGKLLMQVRGELRE